MVVMNSRRVKRVKRSKKYLNHGRRITSRRRYTRIQRGGTIFQVCEKKPTGFLRKPSGITISYDDQTKTYRIGDKPYAELSDRYNEVKQLLQIPPPINSGYISLTQSEFNDFKMKFTGDQCALIKQFNPDVASVASGASVASVASSASSASSASVTSSETHKEFARSLIPNQLKVNEEYIAYMNHSGIVKSFPVDKSKTEYEFDNFTIQLSDGYVIDGNLNVQFVYNVSEKTVTTNFTLNLNVDASQLIKCMQQLIDTSFVGAEIGSIESVFPKKLKVTGVVHENRKFSTNISTYDFTYLIREFAERYQSCSDPAQQMADLRVASPQDVTIVIKAKIAMIEKRLSTMSAEEKTRFEALRQQFAKAGGNLELLEQISIGMDQLADARRSRIYPASVTAGGKTRRKNRIRI